MSSNATRQEFDTEAERDEFIAGYMGNYPPAGYDSHANTWEKDGKFHVICSRASSC